MKMLILTTVSLIVLALVPTDGMAQAGISGLPRIVTLPADDFVYTWGQARGVEARRRPDFNVTGFERSFRCTLTGGFRAASRASDYYEVRQFEQELAASLYFIQDATEKLNELYIANQLTWAVLDCIIPETQESEAEAQEKVDKALERAQRERERRREREARSDD